MNVITMVVYVVQSISKLVFLLQFISEIAFCLVVPPSTRKTVQPRASSFQLNVGQNLLTTVSSI